MNLRESATHFVREGKQNISNKTLHQKTLLFVGSKGVGKTTLINHFLDRNEPSKKTLALEYTFARKTSTHNIGKDVCHIWELGGGTTFTSVLQNGSSLNNCSNLSIVLMLDLSQLHHLWTCLEILLECVKNSLLTSSKHGIDESIQRVLSDHPDRKIMDPFPVPLIIIGGMYDIFQEYEPEKKKIVCRCLRYVSHILCGTLVFYSSKDAALVKRVKDALNHQAFGSSQLKTTCQDYNKAICIPCGLDMFESIEGVGSTVKTTLEKISHVYTTHFPQAISKLSSTILDDPVTDPNFRETLVDTLRRQKDEELDHYCQEMERRAKRK